MYRTVALFPGYSQIVSHSCGKKLGEGQVPLVHHRAGRNGGLDFVMMTMCLRNMQLVQASTSNEVIDILPTATDFASTKSPTMCI